MLFFKVIDLNETKTKNLSMWVTEESILFSEEINSEMKTSVRDLYETCHDFR